MGLFQSKPKIQSNNCEVPIFFAYFSLIYIFASIYYIILTMCIGTPFKDSLTDEQLEIKKKSIKKRGDIFCCGLVIGIIVIYMIQPFKRCQN